MGLVIASGTAIGTLFTLFVLPMFYAVIAAADATGDRAEATAPA